MESQKELREHTVELWRTTMQLLLDEPIDRYTYRQWIEASEMLERLQGIIHIFLRQ